MKSVSCANSHQCRRRKNTDEMLELQKTISTQLEDIRDEGVKQKSIAQAEKARKAG